MFNTLPTSELINNGAESPPQIPAVSISSASVHGDDAGCAKAPSPVHNHALERRFDVVVGRLLPKGLIAQVGSALKESISNVFIHWGSVQGTVAFFYSHFPIPFLFVHVANVATDNANKNVRGA